jgi:hypothetical protein
MGLDRYEKRVPHDEIPRWFMGAALGWFGVRLRVGCRGGDRHWPVPIEVGDRLRLAVGGLLHYLAVFISAG